MKNSFGKKNPNRSERVVTKLKFSGLLYLMMFFINFAANGQYYQTGQDPSSIRWRQINSEHFQVIFPEEFENEAQRVAFVLNKVYDYGSKSLNSNPRRISVILHTHTVNSNGMVAWTPKRMELYTTPHQQIYAQDWIEELAIHEFRHFVQMDKIERELPAIAKILFGEQAASVLVGAYLPLWFLEGDAVVAETALSNSGRGRMASFSMEYRALLIEKGIHSYDKAYLGSFKDYVPNHYKLGYWMVGETRRRYGSQIWADVLEEIARRPLSVSPLNRIIKRSTGFSTKQLYTNIFQELKSNWQSDLESRSIDTLQIASPKKKNYTEYMYPHFINDSVIFAYRTSIDDIGRFVLIFPDKTEKVVYTPGTILDESVSVSGNLIMWAERRSDLRWSHADRSVLRIYNIDSKAILELKPTNKLFSPALSPDLKSFAAVEIDPTNQFFISVFELASGNLIHRSQVADNQFIFTPEWNANGDKLCFVTLSSQGKSIATLDLNQKRIEQLTLPTFANLRNPAWTNQGIIFSCDFSGVDNLYRIDPVSKKITQQTSVQFGADYPAITEKGDKLVFSNYTSSGYQLAIQDFRKKTTNLEIESIKLQENNLAEELSRQEGGEINFNYPDSYNSTSAKYSKLAHLFNFHSWSPAYIDVDDYTFSPGVSIFSQNKLGTAETILGYSYQPDDKTGQFKMSFKYLGWYPEISADLSIGDAASTYYQITNTVNSQNQIIKSDTVVKPYSWNELDAGANLRLPLNFSSGKYSRAFIPELKYTFNKVSAKANTPQTFQEGSYHSQTFRLYFYNILRRSSQSLLPRWGQQFDLIYRNTPYIGKDLGTNFGVNSILYFPGIMRNHGVKIYQGYQQKVFTSNHTFGNLVRSPRGFQTYQNNEMYSFSVDYEFPILYPDISFSKLAFFKRIKSSVFYDFSWLSVPARTKEGTLIPNYDQFTQKSTGFDLTTDFHGLRFFAPVEMGVRTIYRPEFQDYTFQFIFSVDFNGF